MAEFTDEDKRLLDLFRKTFEHRGQSLTGLRPWQEGTTHQSVVLSDKGAIPADVVRGLSGSWAASYSVDYGATLLARPVVDGQTYAESDVLPSRSTTTRLGQCGVPEINFPLYNARTNAFGPKGPSLIGSPISFEVVGPTLKSPACDWTWTVTIATGPNGGDELTMTTRADGTPATCVTLAEAYNLTAFTMGDINEPNGGLYLIVVDDGTSNGALPAGTVPMEPLSSTTDTARYEIFRVASARTSILEIHPNKPFGRYFAVVGAIGIKAILLVRPFATRLAALPSQIRGREQNFAVVAPQRAASGDLYPPYNGGSVADGTWLQGGFTDLTAPGSGTVAGATTTYMGRQALPIPIPQSENVGIVEVGAGTVSTQPAGLWRITLSIPASATLVGKVLHLYQISRDRPGSRFLYGNDAACMGYFEVMSVGGNNIQLSRLPEVHPTKGQIYYGPGPYVQQFFGIEQIFVFFTVHAPISSLFTGPLNADDIEASRIAPLLSPTWTERTSKQRTGTTVGLPSGSSRSKPDRAIFDTSTFVPGDGSLPHPSDPGNLLDLGFRMVLFPARRDAGTGLTVPDFKRPITSREAIIDASVSGPQYVDIDYEAGLVRLSHAPPIAAGGDIVPNGIIADPTTNPRGEVVLFACAVPYTSEESQRGMGPAITTKVGGVFSEPVSANIVPALTNYSALAPYFAASNILPNPVEIVLDRIWDGPQTGVVEIVEGGYGGRSFGIWSYTGSRIVTTGPSLVSTLSLIASSPQAIDPTPGAGETRTVLLRREVVQGNTSATNEARLDDYISDRAYGQALRASALRLPRDRIVLNADGSVSKTTGPSFAWAEKTLGYLAPSKLTLPPRNPTLATPVDNYFGESGLFAGMDYEVPGGDPRAPTPGGPLRRYFEGTALELSATQAAINWHGILTYSPSADGGIVRLNQGLRFSIRFKAEFNSLGQDSTFFMGFLQNEGGIGVPPSVDEATKGAGMDQELGAIGLFADASTGLVSFWSRGSDGITATDNFINTGISAAVTSRFVGPYTFVMETSPYPDVAVRFGLFAENGTLLSTARVSNRTVLPNVLTVSNGLFLVAGIKILGGLPPVMLRIFHISLAQRFGEFDLPFLP